MNILGSMRGRTVEPPQQTGGIDVPQESRPIAKILNGVILVSLIALFFGIPLFFTGTTLQGLMFEKQMYFYFWLLIGLAAWAGKGVIIGDLTIRRTPIDIPLIIFWACCLLATIFSVDTWHSFIGSFGDPSRGFMGLTALILLYYMMLSFLNLKRFRIIFGAFMISGSLVVLWSFLALMNIQFLPDVLAQRSPVSLMGSFTALSIFLGALVPLFVTGIFQATSSETKGILHYIAAGVLFIFLILNLFNLSVLFGFVSWVAMLIGVGFMLVYVLAKIVRPSESMIWVPMVVFVGVLVILMIGENQFSRINLPIEVSPNESLSWEIAKEGMKNDFFVGAGPAMYEYAFSQYRPESYNSLDLYTLRFSQGSGFLYESLPTIGILGTVTFVFLLLTFLGIGLFLLTREKKTNKIRSLGLWSSAVIFIASTALVTSNGSIVLLTAMIGIMALAIILIESGAEVKTLQLSLKASPKYALALAFVFMVISAGVAFLFVYIGKAYVADVNMGNTITQKDITREQVVQEIDKAIRLNPKEGYYWTRRGQEFMALANTEALKPEDERDVDAIRLYLNESIRSMESGKALLPKSAAVQEAVAQIYENAALFSNDYLTIAEQEYRKAVELEAKNPNYHIKIGQIKLSQAQTEESEETRKALVEEAKALFEKSIQLKDNLHAGYYQLALTHEALGNVNAAIENMEKGASLNANSINYFFNLARLYQSRGEGEDNQKAESIYRQILGVNDEEVNVHFSLGILYDKQGKRNEAIQEFNAVLGLLPEEGSEDARNQINKMIENIENGVENTAENIVPSESQEPVEPPQEGEQQEEQVGEEVSEVVDPAAEEVPTPEESEPVDAGEESEPTN